MKAPTINAGEPDKFSEEEQQTFIELVLSGEEVPEYTLRANVPKATRLVFLHEKDKLVGTAALKVPKSSYRKKISSVSGVAVAADQFPYELGYIFIEKAARGKRYSGTLVSNALKATQGQGVFATSRADNESMHKTLYKHGFEKAGQPYAGGNSGEMIQLFLKQATG